MKYVKHQNMVNQLQITVSVVKRHPNTYAKVNLKKELKSPTGVKSNDICKNLKYG